MKRGTRYKAMKNPKKGIHRSERKKRRRTMPTIGKTIPGSLRALSKGVSMPPFASVRKNVNARKAMKALTAKESRIHGPTPMMKESEAVSVTLFSPEDETVFPAFRGEFILDARGDEIATFSRPQPPSFSLRLASPAESQHGNADELVSPWISGCERAPAGSCRRQGTV